MCDVLLRAQNMDQSEKVDIAALAMKVKWEDADAATIASALAELCVSNTGGIYGSSSANDNVKEHAKKEYNKKHATKGNVSKGKAKAKAKPKIRNLVRKKDAEAKIAKKDTHLKIHKRKIVQNAVPKKDHKKVPKDNGKKPRKAIAAKKQAIQFEKSRSQFICRTGGAGKGSTKTISFGTSKPYATMAAARAAAESWLDDQGRNAD